MIHNGDCLIVMAGMEPDSVDSIVTDPPYGLSFMGKDWDHGVPGVPFWEVALRVSKPGAHLLAFGGTRTFHRLACAIEDAGWQIRDTVGWLYGSGFPKSLDVSKAIDKIRDWSKIEQLNDEISRARSAAGLSLKQIGAAMQEATAGQYGAWYHRGGHMFFETGRSLPSRPEWEFLRKVLPIAPEFQDSYDEAEREKIGEMKQGRLAVAPGTGADRSAITLDITVPSTDLAKQWAGWGTALKPAWEPIILARKPLIGTVAANVQTFGTGAMNIDGCRVGTEEINIHGYKGNSFSQSYKDTGSKPQLDEYRKATGRWPANICHDGSDEVLAVFPECKPATSRSGAGWRSEYVGGEKRNEVETTVFQDSGSAARFFYCSKASKKDRGETNGHPTVKPTALMRYLCRLVTPPNGILLDPFMGSGSTGKAAVAEGFRFIGIELDRSYCEIARKRIEEQPAQSGLFNGCDTLSESAA